MADQFDVQVSGDYYEDYSRFNVYLDGIKFGPTIAVTASHALGQTEYFGFSGDFSSVHQVAFSFINDVGGTAGQDRNLYFSSFTFNGITQSGTAPAYNTGTTTQYAAELYSPNDTVGFNVNGYSGPKYAIAPAAETGTVFQPDEVYRFFNTSTGGHFFTISEGERDQVVATNSNYKLEGVGLYGFATDQGAATEEVYRFFNTKTGGHFFTTSEGERDQVIATNQDYKLEGVGFYDFATDQGAATEEVYRFFNTKTGGHFFTTSEGERDQVIATNQAYKFEGIAFYAPDDAGTFVI